MISMIPGMSPVREEYYKQGHWVIRITPPSFVKQKAPVEVHLTDEQYQRYLQWRDRKVLIQDALPDLSKEQREMLMTGLSLDSQKRMFTPEEDEDE